MHAIASRIAVGGLLSIAAIAAAYLWLRLTDDTNTLPMARVLNAGQLHDVETVQGHREPIIVAVEKSATEWQLALVNPTPDPVFYWGEKTGNQIALPRGDINPDYTWRFHDEVGQWRFGGIWVSRKTATQTLPAGNAGRFRISRRENGVPVHIKIAFMYGGTNAGVGGECLWREPVGP